MCLSCFLAGDYLILRNLTCLNNYCCHKVPYTQPANEAFSSIKNKSVSKKTPKTPTQKPCPEMCDGFGDFWMVGEQRAALSPHRLPAAGIWGGSIGRMVRSCSWTLHWDGGLDPGLNSLEQPAQLQRSQRVLF